VLNADGTVSSRRTRTLAARDFTYTVTDGNLVSNTATVLVAVAPVNDARWPRTMRRHDEDTPATYTAAQLLANDADIDSSTLTIASVTSGSNGTAC